MTLFATTTNFHKVPSPVSPASHRSKTSPPTTAKLCARRSTLGRTQLSAARKTLPTTRSCKYSAPLRHSLLHLARTARKPHANLTQTSPLTLLPATTSTAAPSSPPPSSLPLRKSNPSTRNNSSPPSSTPNGASAKSSPHSSAQTILPRPPAQMPRATTPRGTVACTTRTPTTNLVS